MALLFDIAVSDLVVVVAVGGVRARAMCDGFRIGVGVFELSDVNGMRVSVPSVCASKHFRYWKPVYMCEREPIKRAIVNNYLYYIFFANANIETSTTLNYNQPNKSLQCILARLWRRLTPFGNS